MSKLKEKLPAFIKLLKDKCDENNEKLISAGWKQTVNNGFPRQVYEVVMTNGRHVDTYHLQEDSQGVFMIRVFNFG